MFTKNPHGKTVCWSHEDNDLFGRWNRRLLEAVMVNPQALLKVGSWGGLLFDVLIHKQKKKKKLSRLRHCSRWAEIGHTMCCSQAAVFTHKCFSQLHRIMQCDLSASSVQRMLNEALTANAFSMWQRINTIARHKTVSVFLTQWKQMISLFHPDHLLALALRMGTLETAKDITGLLFCIFKKEIFET